MAQFRQQREKGNLAEIGSPTAMPFKCFDRGVRSLRVPVTGCAILRDLSD